MQESVLTRHRRSLPRCDLPLDLVGFPLEEVQVVQPVELHVLSERDLFTLIHVLVAILDDVTVETRDLTRVGAGVVVSERVLDPW